MRWPDGERKPSVDVPAGDDGDEEVGFWSMMRMKPSWPTSSPSWAWVCSRAFSDGGR